MIARAARRPPRTACRPPRPARRPAGPRAARRRPRRPRPAASPSEHAAGDVAAVAGHRAAEVAQHDLVRRRSPGRRRGGGGWRRSPGGDDGEVHLVVALGDEPRPRCRPTPGPRCGRRAGSRPPAAGRRPGRRPRRRRAARRSRRASFTMRSGPTTSTARVGSGARQLRQQLDQEPRPTCGRRWRRRRPAGQARRRAPIGSSVSPHGSSVNTPGLLDHPGRLEPRDDHRRLAVAGHDQHRQPLQRHRRVAGEIRQVVTDRQQQHVDALVRHRARGPGRCDRGTRRCRRQQCSRTPSLAIPRACDARPDRAAATPLECGPGNRCEGRSLQVA